MLTWATHNGSLLNGRFYLREIGRSVILLAKLRLHSNRCRASWSGNNCRWKAKSMVEVHVQLYSILCEKLPPEARGRAILQLGENPTVEDVLRELGIKRRVVISVNGEYEPDRSRPLRDRDEVKVFSSVSGGS